MTNKSLLQKSKTRRHKIIGTVIKVNGRTVGQVIHNVFVKDIKNKHMLTNPPAIASDIQALHDAQRAGAEYCEFTNTDNGIIYRVSIPKVWDMGRLVNYGWGEQQMLPLQHWQQTRDPNHKADEDQTQAHIYSEPTETNDIMPLVYKSRATVGMVWNGKQMSMFNDNKGGE